MKPFYFVQVRLGSTRLPGKVLQTVAPGLTLLELLHSRICMSRYYEPDRLVYLTTTSDADDPLVSFMKARHYHIMRGSETDVFGRYQQACSQYNAAYFFRICADNPFLEPAFLDRLAGEASAHPGLDYISFADQNGRPVIKTHYGFFAELISGAAFRKMAQGRVSPFAREHVTPLFYEGPGPYCIRLLPMDSGLVNPRIRLTVDTSDDLENIRKIVAQCPANFHIQDIYELLAENKNILESMESLIRDQSK
jgi:spore coat polysaccharide biosynthesis protein SpsF (cytidylyltransferase family)